MNDALQALEVKVENGGATPQGKVFAKEWNVLVEAVKALDLKEFDEAALHKFLQDNGYITEDDIPTTDLSNVVTLATEQAIQGRKNFVGGVEVNGQELVYDAKKKVWQLTGDLIVTGAVTMFGNISGFKPSTIMDAVLVDGTTIVKNAQGQLTVIGGGGGNTGGLSVADLETYLSTNKYTTEDAVSSLITEKLTGYATTDWVAQQGYAKQSSLDGVDNRLKSVETFFATSDTDNLVNKWAEIVAFLNATEGDTLDSILSTKANKATTLAGYGITDAYTKSEINNTVYSLNSSIATKWTQNNTKIANWDSAYDWGNHANAGYAAKTYVDTELTKYVKLAVAQSIEAQHNFVNGLQIGGLSITKSGGSANTIYLDANLVISGAFTMFGTDSTTFPTIWANIPFNPAQMSWDGSQWSVIGGGTGSVDDATVRVIVNEVLGGKGYATQKWVTDKDYATVSVVSSTISSALTSYALKTDIPTYTLRASSTIGKFYLQRNGVDSADVTINLPTSLPASDVYAWAKASSKPSYSWSEILSRPTALSQFTNDVPYATQSWVGDNYLSLSGGTIATAHNAPLVVQNLLSGNVPVSIGLQRNETLPAYLVYYGDTTWSVTDPGWYHAYEIFHRGNYSDLLAGSTINGNLYFRDQMSGTGLLIKNGVDSGNAYSQIIFDANGGDGIGLDYGYFSSYQTKCKIGYKTKEITIDDKGFSFNDSITAPSFIGNLTGNADSANYISKTYKENINYTNSYQGIKMIADTDIGISNGFVSAYQSGISVMTSYTGWQMTSFGGDIENPYFRSYQDNGVWKQWRQLAFVTDNVASATKLETPRTIWGQSFDGTRDIWGDLTNVGNIYSRGTQNSGYVIYSSIRWDEAMSIEILDDNGNWFTQGITVKKNGNVAIGRLTADAKLHVHGDIIAQNTYGGARFIFDDSIGQNRAVLVLDPNSGNGVGWGSDYLTIEQRYDGTAIISSTYSSLSFGNSLITVNGNLLVTGAITMFSQLSMKNVIDYEGLSLAQLKQIQPARFTWVDGRDTLIHAGGIADDVMQVLPEVVHRTADDKLTMDYGSAAFYIGASLIKPVIDHERRIADLERENKQLKKQLEQLRVA